jgi:hypothetical protein
VLVLKQLRFQLGLGRHLAFPDDLDKDVSKQQERLDEIFVLVLRAAMRR